MKTEMESGGQKRRAGILMNELLIQGKDFTNQLKTHLQKPPMSASAVDETFCESLVDKILSSYEKALSMLTTDEPPPPPPPPPATSSSSAQITTTHHNTNHCNFKKRKITMGKWSEQVKVCSGAVEGPLSDGYSWRKYGQKDILGANHPRAYYRCTHRNVQGCLATKQVQRSDEDTSVFEVTYKGRHTCIQATQLSKALLDKTPKQEQNIDHDSKPTHKMCIERVFSFKTNNNPEEGLFPSFSFASTPIETEKLENLFYLGCDSTTFITLNDNSDSDLSDMMNSTPNSSTNSPLVDWDFSLDQENFDGNFYFDAEMFT